MDILLKLCRVSVGSVGAFSCLAELKKESENENISSGRQVSSRRRRRRSECEMKIKENILGFDDDAPRGGCRKTARSERRFDRGGKLRLTKKEQRIPSCHIIFRLIYVLWRFVTVFRSTKTPRHHIAHSSSSSSRKSCKKAKKDDRICRLCFAYKLIIEKCETETSCCCCWLLLGGAESDYKDEKSFLMHARKRSQVSGVNNSATSRRYTRSLKWWYFTTFFFLHSWSTI